MFFFCIIVFLNVIIFFNFFGLEFINFFIFFVYVIFFNVVKCVNNVRFNGFNFLINFCFVWWIVFCIMYGFIVDSFFVMVGILISSVKL